jgi:hypothetical protein
MLCCTRARTTSELLECVRNPANALAQLAALLEFLGASQVQLFVCKRRNASEDVDPDAGSAVKHETVIKISPCGALHEITKSTHAAANVATHTLLRAGLVEFGTLGLCAWQESPPGNRSVALCL